MGRAFVSRSMLLPYITSIQELAVQRRSLYRTSDCDLCGIQGAGTFAFANQARIGPDLRLLRRSAHQRAPFALYACSALAIEAIVFAAVSMALTTPVPHQALRSVEVVFQQPAPRPVPPTLQHDKQSSTASTATEHGAADSAPERPVAPPRASVSDAEANTAPPVQPPSEPLVSQAMPSPAGPMQSTIGPARPPARVLTPRRPSAAPRKHATTPPVAVKPTDNPVSRHATLNAIAPAAVQAQPAPVSSIPTLTSAASSAGLEASFEARIRDAVQAALRYPAAARMMNLHGRARVSLDYQAGAVSDLHIVQSAGSPLLDKAALNAVREARLPQAPAEIGSRLLRLLVWVEFNAT
jgi:periplasmic protein TonB